MDNWLSNPCRILRFPYLSLGYPRLIVELHRSVLARSLPYLISSSTSTNTPRLRSQRESSPSQFFPSLLREREGEQYVRDQENGRGDGDGVAARGRKG